VDVAKSMSVMIPVRMFGVGLRGGGVRKPHSIARKLEGRNGTMTLR